MINLEDILEGALAPSSRLALTTPHEFQPRLDSQYVKQERRKLLAEPELDTGFGLLYPNARVGKFSDAADYDLANRSAL